MNTAKLNADGNLVINPLELVLMQQDLDHIIETSEAIEANHKEQIATLKGAFVQLWNEAATATLKGGSMVRVLNNSKVFYDHCAKGL